MKDKAENIIPFDFENNAVRLVIQNDEPWFVAKDVCTILDIANPWDAVARLDEDERDDLGITDAIGRKQEMNVVSESGLYALIFTSRKPQAKRFRKWVTSEVLPSIRKTGGYLTPKASEKMQLSYRLMGLQQHSWKLIKAIKAETNKETRHFLYGQLQAITAEMNMLPPPLEEMGSDAPDVPPVVTQFWATYDALISLKAPINHAVKPNTIAVNLPEFYREAQKYRVKAPEQNTLKKYIKLSTSPRFFVHKAVHSKITDKSIHCYVFEIVDTQAKA